MQMEEGMRDEVLDESDMATFVELRDTELAIARVRNQVETVIATGKCNNCDEPVDGGRKYCDSECALDHHKRLRNV